MINIEKQLTICSKNFFSKLKNGFFDDEEIGKTEKFEIFKNKNREKLTKKYLKSDKNLLICALEVFKKAQSTTMG